MKLKHGPMKFQASPFDLLHGLLPITLPVLPPPFLGPFFAAFLGSAVTWQWPDWRTVFVSLLALFLINTLIIRWTSRLSIFILCIFFILCAGHQMMLMQAGFSAQTRLSGDILTSDARVFRTAETTEKGWDRVVVRLSDGSLVQLSGNVAHLLPGQTVQFLARYASPSPSRNPGGLDEARMLAQEGIFLKADLLIDRLEVTDASTDPIKMTVKQVRDTITDSVMLGLPADQAALLLGILIGDTSRMTPSEKRSFQTAGLSHLMAVSGANVSFILIPILFFLRRTVGKRRTRSAWLIVFLVLFGFLTGWEPSVTRAILMMSLMFAGQLVYRRSDPLNALFFAGTIMLLTNPLLVISTSFHLSFIATLGILLMSEPLSGWLERWAEFLPLTLRQLVSINLSVQIAVLPVQILISGQFSPFTLLANLIAMPLAEGATLLGALGMLAALPLILLFHPASVPSIIGSLVQLICWPARLMLESLTQLASLFADSFWPRFITGTLSVLMILAYICFVASYLMSGRSRPSLRRVSAVLLAAAIMIQVRAVWIRPDVEIILLDVGQGDCTLIRTRDGQVTLIDGGTETAGVRTVQPALRALGISSIDKAVLTHGHQDHAGGLMNLLADGVIRALYVPGPAQQMADKLEKATPEGMETDLMAQVLALAADNEIPVHPLRKDDTIPISSETQLTVMSPDMTQGEPALAGIARTRGANAFNLVLRLTVKDWSMLLTGDCDRETEEALLGNPRLDSDLLRVSHHGSAATTTQQLLQEVSPELAMISVGKNDYGHPAPAVLDRLEQYRIPVLRTDRQGAITIRIDDDRCSVSAMIH